MALLLGAPEACNAITQADDLVIGGGGGVAGHSLGGSTSTTTGTGGASAGGTGGGATTTSTSGTAGAGGAPCVSDCVQAGVVECTPDLTGTRACVNVGSQPEPCLQWVVTGCSAGNACANAACVPACCTAEGVGCCTSDHGTDCCGDADTCLMVGLRNGSELCDDGGVYVDPSANRYFLQCLNARGGIGYVAFNSGPPCGDPILARCQCWEEQGTAPWDELQYIAQMVCDQEGSRLEVSFASAGGAYVGVHPPPGGYGLAGYCPMGEGCMTCVALLEIPW